jgi:hypothetical protein
VKREEEYKCSREKEAQEHREAPTSTDIEEDERIVGEEQDN